MKASKAFGFEIPSILAVSPPRSSLDPMRQLRIRPDGDIDCLVIDGTPTLLNGPFGLRYSRHRLHTATVALPGKGNSFQSPPDTRCWLEKWGAVWSIFRSKNDGPSVHCAGDKDHGPGAIRVLKA